MIWCIYWLAVIATATVVIKVQAFKKGCDARDYVGMIVGQFITNNNWRLTAAFIVSIVLTISAILAGFGRPILNSSLKEAKTFVYENVAESNKIATASGKLNLAVGNIGKAFGFTNSSPAAPITKTANKETKRRYSSWWHWKLAFLSWACFFIYFPIATREEVAAAAKKAWKQLMRKKRAGLIVNQPAVTNPAAAAGASGSSGLFNRWFPRGSFSWHMVIEFLGDYLPSAVMRWIKKL